ncbi:DUF6286 domain-containing protein [Phytomonospora sp. NPDC050363]|uniref:DUF6286 domain-containing protein n=1 Tax=Phytomonospora sp. NPDC050363 TaxID=3155642 RepID=UPI0033C7093D
MRVTNRLVAILLALALMAGGLLVTVEGIMVAAGREPLLVPLNSWYDTLTSITFADRMVLAIAIAVGVLGLLVLVSQLRPWRPERLPVEGAEGWFVRRRSAELGVAGAVDGLPGVSGARARLGKGWRVDLRASGDPATRGDVEETVRAELERMSAPAGRVKVRMTRPRRVS